MGRRDENQQLFENQDNQETSPFDSDPESGTQEALYTKQTKNNRRLILGLTPKEYALVGKAIVLDQTLRGIDDESDYTMDGESIASICSEWLRCKREQLRAPSSQG